jgi:hypothetical protein
MGEMVIFDDGTATVNEPVAITPEANDQVFVTCLRCHAVSHIALKTSKEADAEPTQET